MSREAWAGWGVLACMVMVYIRWGHLSEPVFDAAGSLLLVIVTIWGKRTNLVIFHLIMYLLIGHLIDAIQHPYLQLDNNIAEVLNIIFSTVGAGLLWLKRNRRNGQDKSQNGQSPQSPDSRLLCKNNIMDCNDSTASVTC